MTIVIEFLKTYWKPILGFLLAIGIFLFGFFDGKTHWQAPLLKQVHDYQVAQKEYNDKIDAISKKANEDSKLAQEKIEKANSAIDMISSDYEKLKATKQKTVYIVKDPRDEKKNLPIEFNKTGDMICNRFADEYAEILNKMIEEVNKK